MQLTLASYFIQQQTKLKLLSACASLKKRTSLYSLLDFFSAFFRKNFGIFIFQKHFQSKYELMYLKVTTNFVFLPFKISINKEPLLLQKKCFFISQQR